MKRINFISIFSVFCLSLVAMVAQAQYDDVYYDPSKDGGTSVEETYTTQTKPENNNNNVQEQPDGSNDKYYEDEDYDDYDYYYSSKIRRFHRPMRGFDYYDDCYVNSYNYDPFWSGTTIYVGFDSYYDYRRWRRWNNWGYTPSFFTIAYNPWGWGCGYGSYYSPWSYCGYNPYPPYGNIYYNDYYYGNGWGGYYNNYYDGYHNGNNYGSNVHYGPRKGGSGLTELKGNPRNGRYGVSPSNPRAISNQTPTTNPGRNTVRPSNTSVPNTPPRGNADVLIERKPTTTPARPNVPTTESPRPGRQIEGGRPAPEVQTPRSNDRPQMQTPRPSGRDNNTQQSTPDRPGRDQSSTIENNKLKEADAIERQNRRQERLREIYDLGNERETVNPSNNKEDRIRSTRPGRTRPEVESGNDNNREERTVRPTNRENTRARSEESTPRINRSENNNSSPSVRSSGSGNTSSPRSSGSNSNSGTSSPRSGGRK